MALLFLRRRRPAGVPVLAAVPDDDGPVPDNVRHLPTDLNGIYEMGRLDERLEQERRRRP
ncbi:hypothetical protein GCM10027614_16910 [Micromonospora vulcania]